MSISVFCRECNKTYRVRDELAGKRGKCAQGHMILIPELAPSDSNPTPRREASANGKKCPSCRTVLKDKVVICVNCGFDLRTGKPLARPMAKKKTGPKMKLIGGIGAVLLIAASLGLYFGFARGGLPSENVPAAKQVVAQKEVADSKAKTESAKEKAEDPKPDTKGKPSESSVSEGKQPSPADKMPDDAVLKKAKDRLGGTWTFVMDADGVIAKGRVVFFPEGLDLILIEFFVFGADKASAFSMTLRGFNDKASPMEIDILDYGAAKADVGKVQLGIVEVKNDELRICIARADLKRPTEFKFHGREGTAYYWILKRAK